MSRNNKSYQDEMQENNILTELSDDIEDKKNINPRQRTVMHKQASEDLHKPDDADTKIFNKD